MEQYEEFEYRCILHEVVSHCLAPCLNMSLGPVAQSATLAACCLPTLTLVCCVHTTAQLQGLHGQSYSGLGRKDHFC